MLERNVCNGWMDKYERNYKNFVDRFKVGVEYFKYDTMKDKGLFSKRDLRRSEMIDEMNLIDNYLFMLDILYPVGEGGDNLLNDYCGDFTLWGHKRRKII